MLAATVLLAGAAAAQRVPFPQTDVYGYTAYEGGAAECAVQFVDISSSGTALALTAAGADPALDEGGALLILSQPFELYGEASTSFIVSSNGYIAAATSLAADGGDDFSNDCHMPAVPRGNPSVATAFSSLRLAALHDDLSGADPTGTGADGTVWHQYFASCPRLSEAIGDEACTVVLWHDWGVNGQSGAFSFEAILYHSSFEIVYQYGAGAPSSGYTAGIQSRNAVYGLSPYCYAPQTIADGALCFIEPRYPVGGPQADLFIDFTVDDLAVLPGGQVLYLVTAVNPGPSPAITATVSTLLPPELLACTWACFPGPGASCSAAIGVGSLAESVDLAPQSAVYFELTCDIDPLAAESTISAIASVTEPSEITDPDGTNNTSTLDLEVPIPVMLQSFSVE